MKKAKKLMSLIAATLVALSALTLASCDALDDTPENGIGVKMIALEGQVVAIEATQTNGTLYDALVYFKDVFDDLEYLGADAFTFEGSESEYGFYITSVNGYVPNADANEFWGVYTDLGEYEGVAYSSAEFGTYEYNGKTYASASLGVSGMPLIEGYVYILAVSTYSF